MRIRGIPISIDRNGKYVARKVHYNGKSGSVRVCIPAAGELKSNELVKIEKLENGIILLIPEKVWKNEM